MSSWSKADELARQREVLGQGPRIEPLTPSELTEDAIAINERIREMASRDLEPKTLDNIPEVIGTMLRHAELFEKQISVGLALSLKGALPPRLRELAILRIGWLCGAPYEFGEHALIADTLGFCREEIGAVKQGPDAATWTELEQAILLAVDELHQNAMISDHIWSILSAHLDERQLIELPILIGHYKQTAYVQNSLRLRLHPGNDGLLAG